MGYVNRPCVAFCSDVCRLTREWVYPDNDLVELIVFLHDQYKLPPRKISATINKSGFYPYEIATAKVSELYKNQKNRKRYAAG
jgi:hypothetical protein